MFKSLKSKFALVYMSLVIIIIIVGTTSSISNYTLSKSVNGLMIDNYKSINAAGNMMKALQEQNASVLTFINVSHEDGINSFYLSSNLFNQWFNVASNNITESGETDIINNINNSYDKYLQLFSQLQEASASKSPNVSAEYYKAYIIPEFEHLKKLLDELSLLNEKAMFKGKDAVTGSAVRFMYIMIVLSAASLIIGFLISFMSLKSFLRPLYSLRDTIRKVKDGNLKLESPVFSMDEVGELTVEFNTMTKKLLEFEQSTMGELLAERTKSLAIVKSISDPIIVLDTNYKIILFNNSSSEIFNMNEKTDLTKHILEVIKDEDLYDYVSNIYSSKAKEHDTKILYVNVNNKDYYFNIIVTLLKDSEAATTGLVILFQNVTGLKQLEKIKSEFVATISHEFKTPLTSIMIGLSLISDKSIGYLNNKQAEILSTISEDSERLLSLVNDLLDISRLESNRSVFNIKPHSIIGIIENSIKCFYEKAKNKEVALHYEASDNLPKVNGDFEKISWVLNNLISNALKYTTSGDEILISAFIKQNKMCVSVKDTGTGIPEEYQEKIFEKFIQVSGQDSEMNGTGLGLAIAKELIEAHGGEIWCESKLDVGSIFTFTLPLWQPYEL